MNTRHRGIRLRAWQHPSGAIRYAVRRGRSVGYANVTTLDRAWLDVYLAWYRAHGNAEAARALRERWLATRKVRQ